MATSSLIFGTIAIVFLASLVQSISVPSPSPTPFDLDAEVAALRSLVGRRGCRPRVCFALDGSGSMSDDDWRAQKDFVQLVASIIGVDPIARFAAVQYGLRLKKISFLTPKVNKFLLSVDRARILRAPRTFITSGLGFCISQLDGAPTFPAKIVVLGDGRSNFGGDPRPVARTWLSKDPSNAICAVGVGFASNTLLTRVTNNPNRVVDVNGWNKVVRVTRRVVEDICGFTRF